MEDGILFIDDDSLECCEAKRHLVNAGFSVRTAQAGPEALSLLIDEPFAVVITDVRVHDVDGLELCEHILGIQPDAAVILIADRGTLELAVEAIHVGAVDFLVKPLDFVVLARAVARAVDHQKLGQAPRLIRQASLCRRPMKMVGHSAAMSAVYDIVTRVSRSNVTVLIEGETGTGKELVAKAVHAMGERQTGPFVAINCSAVPALLLESELFGHARGAFTGATDPRAGLFLEAATGTLFLDEIAEIPIDVQPKLLRALQERRARPVGSNLEVVFDTRLIAATHCDLEAAIHDKCFREDLYYRINVVKITLPPLRDRGDDIIELAEHFLHQFGAAKSGGVKVALSSEATERLMSYDWPGNVRELANCMERAVALSRSDFIIGDDLPDRINVVRASKSHLALVSPTEIVTMGELERRHIYRVLKIAEGNKSRAACILGIDRRTLYRMLERYRCGGERAVRGAA